MTHMNDLILGFGCGLYSYFLYTYGKQVWWPDGSLAAALKAFSTDSAWKAFGLCVSAVPLYTSFSNLENDSQIFFYVATVGTAYHFSEYRDLPYLVGIILICFAPFSFFLAVFHLFDLLGWNFSNDPIVGFFQLVFTAGAVILGVEIYKKFVRSR